MNEDLLIPIVLFGSITITVIAFLYFKAKARTEKQMTLRLALDKGQELSSEFLKQLGEAEPTKSRDLRRGVIWTALACGLILIGFAVPEPEALRGMLAGAAIPFTIGLAYFFMYRYGSKHE